MSHQYVREHLLELSRATTGLATCDGAHRIYLILTVVTDFAASHRYKKVATCGDQVTFTALTRLE